MSAAANPAANPAASAAPAGGVRALPLVRADTALVSGWPAWVLAKVLARHVGPYLEGVPGHRRDTVVTTLDAIRVAGLAWEADQLADSGNTATADAAIGARSTHDDLSVDEAAQMMGLGNRRTRMLAPSLGGRKVGGVWVLDRGAVLAELEAREREA